MTAVERIALLEKHELPSSPDDLLALWRMVGANAGLGQFWTYRDGECVPAADPEPLTELKHYQIQSDLRLLHDKPEAKNERQVRQRLLHAMALSLVLLARSGIPFVIDSLRFCRYPEYGKMWLLCSMAVRPPTHKDRTWQVAEQ